jgi:tRNA A37 threonylcarbamoyladenosine synthetase subunit TsaC/SUA5/YrdC
MGELVAFPTNSLRIGANAFDPVAVRKIFNVKDDPDNPLIVHLHSVA